MKQLLTDAMADDDYDSIASDGYPESTNWSRMLALEDRLLEDAQQKRLRKLDGVVYSPLPGRPCAYVPGLTYKRHISSVFKSDRDLRAAPENVSRLETFLMDHVDLDPFPELEPNLNLVSFDNGVINIRTMEFTDYVAIEREDEHQMRDEVARHHIALPWTGAIELWDKLWDLSLWERDRIPEK
jgi:hypothetical protein